MLRNVLRVALLFPLCLTAASAQTPSVRDIKPVLATDKVSNDPDDPAVWVHPTNPARSLIVGTNKVKAKEGGALYVFGMDGKTKQVIKGIDRPNNVDIEYGLRLKNGQRIDIVVTTERLRSQLRIFAVRPDGSGIKEIGALPVFQGETPEDHAAPMGISLYKRPKDGAIFAIVGRKSGPKSGYLWQYRLEDNGKGGIKGTKVRAFGGFSGDGEIEAIAVDDALGYVYYADEGLGIRKWHADPDHPGAAKELAVFGKTGFRGDREGIGIFTRPDGTGYLVCTDQLKGNSEYHLYKREGEPGRPHDHSRLLGVVRGGADETDGLEVVSVPVGPRFPRGLMITMNSGPKNFLVFDWRDVQPRR
jgi:3-phytase